MFNPLFWLSVESANANGVIGYVFLGIVVAMVLLGIVCRVLRERHKRDATRASLFRHLGRLLMTMGLIGTLLFFFIYEDLRFLGGRFWYPLWLLVTLVWAGWIVWFAKKKVPMLNAQMREQAEREKYLPRPKK